MNIPSVRLVAAVALAGVIAAGCDVKVGDNGVSVDLARGQATDEWTRTYTLPAGGQLDIVNGNGPIEAIGTSGSQVVVRVERRVRAGLEETAADFLKKVEMREDVTPDRVRIEAIADERALRGFGRARLDVRYFVQVPAGLTLSFRTSNGGIRLDDVDGRIVAVTTNGGITGNDLSGSVDMLAVNGGLQVGMASVSGDVKLSTTNGGVRLDLPRDARANLDASCVNGGINIDDEFNVDTSGEGARRRVSASLNGGGARITAATVNGGIRIRARGPAESE